MNYSRSCLMSLRYWWKDLDKSGSTARNVLSRESFKPLSATIWYSIKSAGILKPTRAKRGGIRPRLTETQFGLDIISATNRWFSRYVIAAMLVDENTRFLISSFCSSTSICTLQHCYLCPWRLVANHLYYNKS